MKRKKNSKVTEPVSTAQNANRNTSYPKYQAEEEENGLGRDDSAVHGACREGCEGIEESLLRSQLFCFYLVDAPSCCVDHKFPKSACGGRDHTVTCFGEETDESEVVLQPSSSTAVWKPLPAKNSWKLLKEEMFSR